MELRQLYYFRAAARSLSFTAAAKDCFVAQASLSQQIKQLEKELDTQLFIRKNNTLQLTESGEILLRDAERILGYVEETKSRIENASHFTTFRLGFYGHAFGNHFAGILDRFHRENPEVQITLTDDSVEKITAQLLRNELDGIVCAFDGMVHNEPSLIRELLWESGYSLLLPAGMYPDEMPVALSEQLKLPVITLSSIMQRQINQKLAIDRCEIPEEVALRANTHHALNLLVASGQCAALVPTFLARNTQFVRVHSLTDCELLYQSYFIGKKENENPYCRKFVDCCRAYLADIV